MGSIARMNPKLPPKCRDVSWPSPPTPNSKSFFWKSIVIGGMWGGGGGGGGDWGRLVTLNTDARINKV